MEKHPTDRRRFSYFFLISFLICVKVGGPKLKHTFLGGIHPLHREHEGKPATSGAPIRPFVAPRVVIPVGMHIGAPSAPIVKKGDRVAVGQVIAEPIGGLGLPVHASISGTVTEVEMKQQLRAGREICISIEADGSDEWVELTPVGGVEDTAPEDIIAAMKNAGISGMGGASFPAHIKLSIPEGKFADIVIINGAECEPFLTCDHRLMLEESERIVKGVRLLMRAAKVGRAVIAIEDNKPDAIKAMTKAAAGYPGIEIFTMVTKYPQGAEKQLIKSVTGREVPRGKLPLDAHALVFNVGTAAATYDAVVLGKPVVERVTTITGSVNKPSNLRMRIGTIYEDAINEAGGISAEDRDIKVFAGGPMCGLAAPNLTVSMTKATNGIITFSHEDARIVEETPCIRCGRCVDGCAMGLMPFAIRNDLDRYDLEAAKAKGLMDCVLCGACSYSCPANRFLTSAFKSAKEEIAARARRK